MCVISTGKYLYTPSKVSFGWQLYRHFLHFHYFSVKILFFYFCLYFMLICSYLCVIEHVRVINTYEDKTHLMYSITLGIVMLLGILYLKKIEILWATWGGENEKKMRGCACACAIQRIKKWLFNDRNRLRISLCFHFNEY